MSKHHVEEGENAADSTSTKSMHEKLNIKPPMTEAELLAHPSYLELQKKLNEAEQKSNENWDKMLRMQAEMENLRRRVERDVENAHKYALEKFVSELLPVIDSLERSLTGSELGTDAQHLTDGISLTLKMFYSALEKFGVKQVDPLSQPFNPELHQAVSTVEDDSPPGTVVNVLQKGYLLNNRLVRPALVVVAKAT